MFYLDPDSRKAFTADARTMYARPDRARRQEANNTSRNCAKTHLHDVAHHKAGDGIDEFIPVRKHDIIEALVKSGGLDGGEEREKFRLLCRMLEAIVHYEYFGVLKRLRHDYYYFGPDVEPHAAMDRDASKAATPISCNRSIACSRMPTSSSCRTMKSPTRTGGAHCCGSR